MWWPVSPLSRDRQRGHAWPPTPLAAGEPSPALLVRTRGSSTRPALPRHPSVPPLDRPLAKLRVQDLFSTNLLLPSRPTFSGLLDQLSLAFNPPTTTLPLAFNPQPTTQPLSSFSSQLFFSLLQPLPPRNPPGLPFVARGSAPSPRPVFSPASLRASPRSLSKGACPLDLPPPRPIRGLGSQFWLGAREIIPPKRGPSLI